MRKPGVAEKDVRVGEAYIWARWDSGECAVGVTVGVALQQASDTEYMCVIERKTGETVKMQGAEVVKVDASDRVRWRQMVYCGEWWPIKGAAWRRRRSRTQGNIFM